MHLPRASCRSSGQIRDHQARSVTMAGYRDVAVITPASRAMISAVNGARAAGRSGGPELPGAARSGPVARVPRPFDRRHLTGRVAQSNTAQWRLSCKDVYSSGQLLPPPPGPGGFRSTVIASDTKGADRKLSIICIKNIQTLISRCWNSDHIEGQG